MDLPFDIGKIGEYAEKAKSLIGDNDILDSLGFGSGAKSDDGKKQTNDGLMAIFKKFGDKKGSSPEGSEAQGLVGELWKFISSNLSNVTPQMFSSISKLITGGEAGKSIDGSCGKGTTDFIGKAVDFFCKNKK